MSLVAEMKLLLRRIEMVELKCGRVLGKAANRTPTSGFLHESALHGSSSLRHRRGIAFCASVSALPSGEESGVAVAGTLQVRPLKSRFACGVRFLATNHSIGFQAQPTDPVPDRRIAGAQFLCDAPDRFTFIDQLA